jgi:hypothetical protein
VLLTPAYVQDRDAAKTLLARARRGLPRLAVV